jgi:hypothetical protein
VQETLMLLNICPPLIPQDSHSLQQVDSIIFRHHDKTMTANLRMLAYPSSFAVTFIRLAMSGIMLVKALGNKGFTLFSNSSPIGQVRSVNKTVLWYPKAPVGDMRQ